MFFDHGYFMGGMHALWWIFWIFLLIAVVVGLRSSKRRSSDRDAEASPLDMLKRRLAKGEISSQEYEATKALLDRDAGKS